MCFHKDFLKLAIMLRYAAKQFLQRVQQFTLYGILFGSTEVVFMAKLCHCDRREAATTFNIQECMP